MSASPELLTLADQNYVALSTFRKNGEIVSTAVWVAQDGESLIVTTAEESGKVKRLRNDPRVRLAPASFSGKVAPGAATVEATVTIEPSAPELDQLFAAKYKLMYRMFGWMERRRKSEARTMVVLRIT